MKLFKCQHCGEVLYFENRLCGNCGHRLGYLPEHDTMTALDPDGSEWAALASETDRHFRFCDNAGQDACNWLVPADSSERFCLACRHNHIIPDLTAGSNLAKWRKLELAKHRLFYTLLRLGLPLATRAEHPEGLVFDFLAESAAPGAPKVLTGHDNGLITLNLNEADDAAREKLRQQMGEPYRTLLGHFRHEVGHYFWDRLVRDAGHLDACRAVFGDDSQDYNQALQRHYADGAPANWQENFVSAYATAHPWEDFAETWAHYLHIVDTLEMGSAFGMRVRPRVADTEDFSADLNFDPHAAGNIDRLIGAWLPLTFAVNNLNRCMGEPDLYPFLLSPAAIHKLDFIHRLVHGELPA
jgi:hypothetical protein